MFEWTLRAAIQIFKNTPHARGHALVAFHNNRWALDEPRGETDFADSIAKAFLNEIAEQARGGVIEFFPSLESDLGSFGGDQLFAIEFPQVVHHRIRPTDRTETGLRNFWP